MMPQSGLFRSLKIEIARYAIRNTGPMCPMHQKSPFRGQTILIHAKPQINRHREDGTAHVQMVLYMFKRRKKKYPCSLDSAPYDCIVLGIFYCFRLSKWVQNASDKTQPLTGPDGLPLALILPDLTFLSADRFTIPSHGRLNFTTPASNSSNPDREHRKI